MVYKNICLNGYHRSEMKKVGIFNFRYNVLAEILVRRVWSGINPITIPQVTFYKLKKNYPL
jgi:hypothetical protein